MVNNRINRAFVWFLIGFGIGYIFLSIVPEDENSIEENSNVIKNVSSISLANRTVEDVKKIRILCFLNSRPATHSTRAIHILETWGKHCDKLLFSSTITDVNIGAIGFNVTDTQSHVWGKVKLMLKYIHRNYLNEYDWFIKGDDEIFLMPENLRFLLSAYSPDDPIYFGHKFNMTALKRGYFSGGSGYVMSKETLRIFVEKVLTNPDFYNNPDSNCNIATDKRVEDYDITACLDHYNVYAGDARDLLKRDRFFPFWPEAHLFGEYNPYHWYWQRKYYWNDEGLDCCSNYSIAFHYISARYQYTMYYLIYRLKTFGIMPRFPAPPTLKDFIAVTDILDRERFDVSLRGYFN